VEGEALSHPQPSRVVKCVWEGFVWGFGVLFLSGSGGADDPSVLCASHPLWKVTLFLLSVAAPLLALCSCEWFVLLSCACARDLLIV